MDTAKIKNYMRISYVPSQSEIDRQVNLLKQENDKYQTSEAKKLSDEKERQMIASSGQNMGVTYLIDLDEAIVGTAFAQFVLEGKIAPGLKYYVTRSLERQMLPILMRQFGKPDQQQAYKEKITKLLQVVRKMPS